VKNHPVQIWPDTKAMIDKLRFNFSGLSQQKIIAAGVRLFYEQKLNLNGMNESDMKKLPIGWEPVVADKAKSYLKRIGSGHIVMGYYGPYFMEEDVKVLIDMNCFEYMIADGDIEALSAKEYRKRCL